MSGNSPSRPRRNSSDSADLVPVKEQLFKRWNPEGNYRGDFATIFPTSYARKIMYSLSGRQCAVLYALLSLWNFRKREIETSITQIKEALEISGIPIGAQHISSAITALKERNVLQKVESGQNRLIVKINPFLAWKGYAHENNRTRTSETSVWGDIPADF